MIRTLTSPASQETIPETQGIKYAGSKLKLIPHILQMAARTDARTVLDAFSGTTRVSQAFARSGMEVTANDSAAWSECFATCYLLAGGCERGYGKLIDHLNGLEGKDGWFTENYGGDGGSPYSDSRDGLKKPFQLHNTQKLDAIRQEIDRLGLNEIERSVALTSLILALDKVDSTLGHQASYLRKWSKRSYKPMRLEVPRYVETPRRAHRVIRKDVFEAIRTESADLAYLDPPYGSNNEKMPPSRVRYNSYYHLWTTVVLNDRPELFGKAKRRKDSSDPASASVFEEFRKGTDGRYLALAALDRLIGGLDSRFVLLSYSSGGRVDAKMLAGLMSEHGDLIDSAEIDYRRNVMAEMSWTGEWKKDEPRANREYLFLLKKK